jgi:uncharacterized protein (DUF1015 family)/uncharacterized membrane protein YtjA (UPF0391 family)
MANTYGLVGLRPAPEHVAQVASPPYDVVQMGPAMDRLLASNPQSLFQIILAQDPARALEQMKSKGWFIPDEEPCYYVYEQRWQNQSRLGVLFAGEVSDYSRRHIIRHEKTFPEKVRKSIALKQKLQFDIGPVFLFTQAPITSVLESCTADRPLYSFRSDSETIQNRIWRIPELSEKGALIQKTLASGALYIADGHHRYQAALDAGLQRFVAYATEHAQILAYNRVVNGEVPFRNILKQLPLVQTARLATPPKHTFCLYSKGQAYLLSAQRIPPDSDVVGRLDCSILERELYPYLGLRPDMIRDPRHFDCYPESKLAEMKALVDAGEYDLAIALHPVSINELIAVADAGIDNPKIVMPEKSTFFSPKVLSGLFLQKISFSKKIVCSSNHSPSLRGYFSPTLSSQFRHSACCSPIRIRRNFMLRASIAFFVIGLVAYLLGLYGVAGLSVDIGKILLTVFLIIGAISLVVGLVQGRPPKALKKF